MDKQEDWLTVHTKPGKTDIAQAQYKCQKCMDTGWILFCDENGYEMARRCSCYAVNRARELMENSGISEEFRKKSFGSFNDMGNHILADAKNKAVSYVKEFRKNRHCRRNSIMFCGQPGCGKTHLGTAICSSLMEMGVPVIYMPYRNAMTRLKQHIMDEQAYIKDIGIYMDASVLYIDDLLKGKLTDTDVNVVYEIVNYRYMNNLPLVISTEKDLAELLAFDEATGSRIIEMCRSNITVMKGKDLNYRLCNIS